MTATNIRCAASAKRGGTTLFAIFLLLAPQAVRAAPRDDVKDGVARCDDIADDHAWLDCFYGAAQPMRSRLGLAPAPEFQTRLVPPAVSSGAPAPGSRGSGSLFSSVVGAGDVEARQPMTAYSFDRAGLFTVTLVDGSVWQQLSNDGIRAGWRGAANGYVVTVSQGALGGTSLTIAGTGVHYKVKRLR
jgi:hypothetical protein